MSRLSQFSGSSIITGFNQTAVLRTNQSVAIPAGTKRIEALICGGGSAYGFGGLQIYEIPVVGTTLDVVVGLGTRTSVSGESSVSISGVKYAAVGGMFASSGAVGYPPFNKNTLLWSALDHAPRSGVQAGSLVSHSDGTAAYYFTAALGMSLAGTYNYAGVDAAQGWGGSSGWNPAVNQGHSARPGGVGATGGEGTNSVNGVSGAGQGGNGIAGGSGGPGGYLSSGDNAPYNGYGGSGGSMQWCSVWWLTGFEAGLGGNGYLGSYHIGPGGGGGGGGMLGAGANGTNGAQSVPGSGGNGGDGGGAGGRAFIYSSAINGKGGNGFVIFRFFY